VHDSYKSVPSLLSITCFISKQIKITERYIGRNIGERSKYEGEKMFAKKDKVHVDYKFEALRLDVCGIELMYITLLDGCK
jgi:hypothetical protein